MNAPFSFPIKLSCTKNNTCFGQTPQRAKIAEHESFRKIVDQVVHDIRSPLASMSIILGSSGVTIPEKVRITLRNIAVNITDIANNMLNIYAQKEFSSIGNATVFTDEKSQVIMIYPLLLQILSDKKYQYHSQSVKFTSDFNPAYAFVAIKIKPSDFKRMMSNLINNAVEACGRRKGTIHIGFNINEKNIEITIQDNGKGMSKEKVAQILRNTRIVSDKKGGYGIGLAQARETLRLYKGGIAVESKFGKGTKMTLSFPIVLTPAWVAKNITFTPGDTVIIMDDDRSIHGAWEARFANYADVLTLKHFTVGSDVVNFINTFPKKDKIFLLADFELLRQGLNGIEVIKQTQIKRAILVTSHYNNSKIRNLAQSIGVKILPKELAADITVEIKNGNKVCSKVNKTQKVDLVIVDDDELLADSLTNYFINQGKNVDKYYSPTEFLKNLSNYALDAIILLDYEFHTKTTGLDLAKKLYAKGFKRLYLFSGKDFNKKEVPSYLTVISKTDINSLAKLVN